MISRKCRSKRMKPKVDWLCFSLVVVMGDIINHEAIFFLFSNTFGVTCSVL